MAEETNGHSALGDFHVVIVGAGSSGCLIAQALKKNGISFSIFEKETVAQRPRDWGMAYFWSADYLPKLLPPELVERLPEAQVDPWYKAQPVESMTVTNGDSGEDIKLVPSPGGRRVGRRALRKLFMTGIDVNYGHRLKSITHPVPGLVTASFDNGISVTGNLLIGTDGGSSAVRRHLLGPLAQPTPLPFHMVNFNASYRKPEQAVYIRKHLRHFVDHGVHPKGMFFLMTLQSVPDPNDPTTWSFQITITWPPSMDPDPKNPGPPHSLEKLKKLTSDWYTPKKEAIAWLEEGEVSSVPGFHTPGMNGHFQPQLNSQKDEAKASKLRPATDVLNRLLWDSEYSADDFIIGYNDRFKGTMEILLSSWQKESTEEEFIPQHRIEYFRRKDDVEFLWHREARIDRVFGSGVSGDTVGEAQILNRKTESANGNAEMNGEAPTSRDRFVAQIPSDRIAVWEPVPWDNQGGCITLAGDAAHCMTFHRGQGLNNCIRDAKELTDAVVKHVKQGADLKTSIDAYEDEMRDRGAAEVRLSRKQTEMEHDWELFWDSPVMQIGGKPIRPVEWKAWKDME